MLYIKNTAGRGVVALAKTPIYFKFPDITDTFDFPVAWGH